jgi:hypothetical protein
MQFSRLAPYLHPRICQIIIGSLNLIIRTTLRTESGSIRIVFTMECSLPNLHMRIPPEVLSSVIRHALPYPLKLVKDWTVDHNGHHYWRNLLSFTHVCQFWREIAIADTGLWATLVCELHESLFVVFVDRAKSKGHPVKIYAYHLTSPSAGSARQYVEASIRLIQNLSFALKSGIPINELSASLADATTKCLFKIILSQYHHALDGIQNLQIFSMEPEKFNAVPLLHSTALNGLQFLDMHGCLLEWSALAEIRQLRSLTLYLNLFEAKHQIQPTEWRTILEVWKDTLEVFVLGCEPDFSNNTNNFRVKISPGQRIYMEKLREVNFDFVDCLQFVSKLSHSSSTSIYLTDRSQKVPDMSFFNLHFIPLTIGSTAMDMSLAIEYYADETNIALHVGDSPMRYTFARSSIAPEALMRNLEFKIRNSVTHLSFLGSPLEADHMNFRALSDLFPQVTSITMDKLEKLYDPIIFSEFLKIHREQMKPPFPKLSILGLVNYQELRGGPEGMKDLLLEALAQRMQHGVPLNMLRLSDSCGISSACIDGIKKINPRCILISEDALRAYRDDEGQFTSATTFPVKIIESPPPLVQKSLPDFALEGLQIPY